MVNLVELNKRIDDGYVRKSGIAKALGITVSSVNNKLDGTTKFNVDEVKELSKILHLSAEELYSIFFA